jgi:hypothetical protein
MSQLMSFDSNVLESLAPYITTISQPVDEVKKNLIKLNNWQITIILKSDKNYLYKSKLREKQSVIDLKKFKFNMFFYQIVFY